MWSKQKNPNREAPSLFITLAAPLEPPGLQDQPNFAAKLGVTAYFFLLRGKEARTLLKKQLERFKPAKEEGSETWKVTLTHSKTDPLILGQLPHGGSWSGFSSNPFLSEVLNFYLQAFLGNDYPSDLPLFPQVDPIAAPADPNNSWSRRVPGHPGKSWLLHPVETISSGKKRDGFLTQSDSVNKWLKTVLAKIDVYSHHTMHSLRVGAATEALALGAPISQIKKMGHWKSMAVMTYALDNLASIEETTRQFGKKEFSMPAGIIDMKDKISKLLEENEDGGGDDENGEKALCAGSSIPAP